MAGSADWVRDGKTHDSGSVISGLGSIEDASDQLGQAILQHARDQQRVDQVLTANIQAFRKARPLHFDREDAGRDSDSASHSSNASNQMMHERTQTIDSEPSYNIPRDWGRKGRVSTSWLRRGLVETDRTQDASPGLATTDHGTGGFDDVVYERIMPSGQSRTIGRPPIALMPTSGTDHGTLEAHDVFDQDHDFTNLSLLQGTPAIAGRALGSSAARRHEWDAVKSYARDRDLLSRITEKTTPETSKSRRGVHQTQDALVLSARALKHSPSDRKWGGARALQAGKENIPIHSHGHTSKNEALEDEPLSSTENAKDGSDAVSVLKRLARAQGRSLGVSPIGNTSYERPQSNEARALRQSSAHAPEVVMQSDATSGLGISRSLAKTPRVMGAWIDTPAPARREAAHDGPITTSYSPTAKNKISAPPPPVSALHNLLHTKNSSDNPLQAGDETLASLAAMLDSGLTGSSPDLSATLNLDEIRAELEALDAVPQPLSKVQEERRDELLALEGMSARLRAARKSVQQVGQGLRDVEKRMLGGTSDITKKSSGTSCESCSRGVWRGAWEEALGIVVATRSPSALTTTTSSGALVMVADPKTRPKLTLFGIAALSFIAWWAVEASLWVYCRPRFATSMSGFGIDADAPEFPLVLPTLLFRPQAWLWSPLSRLASWLFTALWSGLIGVATIPFVQSAGRDPAASSQSVLQEPVLSTFGSRLVPDHAQRQRKHEVGKQPLYQPIRGSSRPISHDDRAEDDDDDSMDTMSADAIVAGGSGRDQPVRGRLGKLWSWRSSPAQSAAEAAVRPATAETFEALQSRKAQAVVHRYHRSERDGGAESIGNLWETGEGGRVHVGASEEVEAEYEVEEVL